MRDNCDETGSLLSRMLFSKDELGTELHDLVITYKAEYNIDG